MNAHKLITYHSDQSADRKKHQGDISTLYQNSIVQYEALEVNDTSTLKCQYYIKTFYPFFAIFPRYANYTVIYKTDYLKMKISLQRLKETGVTYS